MHAGGDLGRGRRNESRPEVDVLAAVGTRGTVLPASICQRRLSSTESETNWRLIVAVELYWKFSFHPAYASALPREIKTHEIGVKINKETSKATRSIIYSNLRRLTRCN